MIYVFSNAHNYKSLEEFGKKIQNNFKSSNDDTIILLNTCVPLKANRSFFKDKTVYSLNRGFSIGNVISYFGFDYVSYCRSSFKKVFSVHHDSDKKEFFLTETVIKSDDNNRDVSDSKDISLKNLDFFLKYPGTEVPTTGYIAYHIFQEICNDEVTLVNFYGSKNNTTPKDKCHKWNFEEEFFADKRKIFI